MKRKIEILMIVLTLFVSGCSVGGDIGYTRLTEEICCRQDVRVGIDVEFLDADLDDDVKTTPVHPNDAGFLSGNTTTSIDSNIVENANPVPYVGWEVGIGSESVRLIGGTMIRLNMIGLTDDYRKGIHGVEKQSSDGRPGDNASFAYTHVEIDPLTIEPDVGVRLQNDEVWTKLKVGFPYSSIEVESGWDRWGAWQQFNSERWRGFGLRPSVEIGSTNPDRGRFSFRLFYLRYNTGFGKLDGCGFSCNWEW